MLCAIYRSKKKPGSYLYLPLNSGFDVLPEGLLEQFSSPERFLIVPLDGSKPLVGATLSSVKAAIDERGYYLQLAKKEENLLETFRQQQKKSS